MTVPTPPAVSEAMREAVAQWLKLHFGLVPNAAKRFAGYFCADNGPIASEIARLTGERDTWKLVARGAGVCMTCALGAPDTFGCTDCLNTGFEQGAPQGYVPEGYHAETVARLTARAETTQAALSRLKADREAEVAKLKTACDHYEKALSHLWDGGSVLATDELAAARKAHRAVLTETPDA